MFVRLFVLLISVLIACGFGVCSYDMVCCVIISWLVIDLLVACVVSVVICKVVCVFSCFVVGLDLI